MIIDDNEAIHDDIRKCLSPLPASLDVDELEAVLFHETPVPQHRVSFEISSAYQGQDGLEQIQRARGDGAPFSLVFMDVHMPPGWDGIETLSHIWREDPWIQAVLCSAYSDYSWNDIKTRLPRIDGLMILRKPFDAIEILQMAYALTEKWNHQAELAQMIKALQKSEANHRALLHAVPDAILRFNGRGHCLGFKPAMTHAEFLSPRGASPAPPGDDLSTELPRHLANHAKQVIDKGTAVTAELSLRVDGQERHYEARIARIAEDEAVAVVRDMTELRRAMAREAEMQRREAAMHAQAEALLALTMPLIPISDRVVVMPLVGDLDARRVGRIGAALVQRIASCKAEVAIVDFTGVPSLDATAAEELIRMARAARLLGARLVLTGFSPEAVRRLAEIRADLPDITTRQTLQQGIEFAMRRR